MYIWSPLKNNLLPTLSDIKSAFKKADDPDPKQRDVRPLMALLTRLPVADPDVASAMELRKLQVKGYDFRFQPSVDTDSEKQRAAEMTDHFIRSDATHVVDLIFAAKFFGYAAGNPVFSTGETIAGHTMQTFNFVDVSDIIPDASSPSGYSRVEYADVSQSKYTATALTYPDFYFVRSNPFASINAAYVGGLLRIVLPIVYLKHVTTHFFSRFVEQFGGALKIAEYDPNTSNPADITTILTGLEKLGSEQYAAIPNVMKLTLLEAAKTGSVDVYNRFIEMAYAQIQQVLRGEALTTKATSSGTKDQRGSAAVANDVRSDVEYDDVMLIERHLNTLYVPQAYTLNYGQPPGGIFPRAHFVMDDEQVDYKSNALIVESLTAAGYTLDDAQVAEKTGFTVTRTSQPTVI